MATLVRKRTGRIKRPKQLPKPGGIMSYTVTREELLSNIDKIAADLCRTSFEDFVREFWSVLIAEKMIWNWHMTLMCDEVQKLLEYVIRGEPVPYDLIINVPPGSTKSTIITQMAPAWLWTRMPHARTICSSYAEPLSLFHSVRTRDIVASDIYRRWFGIEIDKTQNQKKYFKNTVMGGRFAVSTNGTVTGMHSHVLFIDDPMNPKEAASDKELKTSNDWHDHTLLTRKIEKELCPYILVMQRLHEADTTQHFLDKKTPVRHICLPAEAGDNIIPPELEKHYVDGLLDPVRMKRKVLDKMRLDMGPYNYAGQMLQKPAPEGGGSFKVTNLVYRSVVPEDKMFTEIVRFWDKAITAGGGAYTVGTKMGKVKNGNEFVVLDVIRGQWDKAKRENIIKSTAEIDGVPVKVYIEQEPGSGGKESADATIANLAGFSCYAIKATGDKEVRADPFAVQMDAGNITLVKAPWNIEWVHEHALFPNSKYKDQVDSASGAFNVLAKKKKQARAW